MPLSFFCHALVRYPADACPRREMEFSHIFLPRRALSLVPLPCFHLCPSPGVSTGHTSQMFQCWEHPAPDLLLGRTLSNQGSGTFAYLFMNTELQMGETSIDFIPFKEESWDSRWGGGDSS